MASSQSPHLNNTHSIRITFKDDKDGSVTEVQAPLDTSVLEVAHANDIDLEGSLFSNGSAS